MLKRLKLAQKLLVVYVLIFAVSVGAIAYINFFVRSEFITAQVNTGFQSYAEEHTQSVNNFFSFVNDDLYTVRSFPRIDGYFRALAGNGKDSQTGLNLDLIKLIVNDQFAAMIGNRDYLLQISLVDVSGQTLLSSVRQDNTAVPLSGSDLKNLSADTLFTDLVQTKIGDVYTSELTPLDLSSSDPVNQQRVIYYGLSIVNESGVREGFLLLGIDSREPLKQLIHQGSIHTKQGDFLVVNSASDLLYLSDEHLIPMLALTKDNKIDSVYPELRDAYSQNDVLFRHNNDTIALQRIYPNSKDLNHYYNLVYVLSNQDITNPFSTIAGPVVIINLGLFLFLILSTYYVTRKLVSDPIRLLAKTASAISSGDLAPRVAIDSNDEFGELAKSFNLMADGLTSVNKDLEEKVTEKTKELNTRVEEIEKKNSSLEETKKAIMNVMEDVETAKSRVDQEKVRADSYLESIADGIIVIDKSAKVIRINDAAVELLKGVPADFLNKDVNKVINAIGKNDKHSVMRLQLLPIVESLSTGKKNKREYYLVRSDGSRVPIRSSVSPVVLGKEVIGAVEVIRDITKEKEIDLAKSEFVSLVSHQLRTPITTLNWYTEMILDSAPGKMDAESISYINEIREASFRMLDLVNALLDVSRIELGTMPVMPESINLADIARSVVNEHKSQVTTKKLQVEEKYSPELPMVMSDKKITRMIFENLISNAVKYTPDGGKIVVDVYPETKSEEGKPESKWAIIKISDTGIGIPPEQKDKIFDKMFRADNVKELDVSGTGLGLYILNSVVKNIGGKIWFESELNKGSTFFVQIPVVVTTKLAGANPILPS
jgi:PAS domain S-box-containing protein